jgi:asparagine synthase (glutamine-hydrolysing)
MAHRGPDDDGLYVDRERQVVLGHRRLSIIDVGNGGHQPMSFADGRYWIVFNGEIYNYMELRSQLEKLGHNFASQSDTEVLVASYAEWGEHCVSMLRGMFAFAILDRDARAPHQTRLFLARDRLGIKPLYYTRTPGFLAFASEIKGLLASQLVSRRLDTRSVWQYLSLGSVPQPSTILADVKMLLPGHTMKVTSALNCQVSRYWSLDEAAQRSFPHARLLNRRDAARELRHHLEEAIRYHMIADVPVAAFLSGGIDSSAITGLMSAGRQSVATFSIGFENGGGLESDERKWARIAAERFGTAHAEVVVGASDAADSFPGLIKAIDQPSLDGTNTYLVSKAAGASYKVALSGLGGDELFAGYGHFRTLARVASKDRWLNLLGPVAKKHLLCRLPGRFVPDRELLLVERSDRYLSLRLLCEDEQKSAQLRRGFVDDDTLSLREVYAEWLRPELDVVAETSHVELHGYLANTLLRDSDAVAMANSLEVRPVLLDHRLVEFAFALPSRLKVNGSVNKPVLVESVRDLLPDALIYRPKRGFELPLLQWMTTSLQDRALAAFESSISGDIFSKSFLADARSQIRERACKSIQMWASFILLEWLTAHSVSV